MYKEYLQKHSGEQVDFDKVEEGWNDKVFALNDLRSTANMVEVVIVSQGSVLGELINGMGGWRSGQVRSYSIDDNARPGHFLDKRGLELYRSHSLNQHMIPTSDQIYFQPLGPSILAGTLTHNPSGSSEKAPAVKIKAVIQIVAKNTSKNTKEEIVKVSKRCETHLNALFKLFQEELPPNKVEGGDIEGSKHDQ